MWKTLFVKPMNAYEQWSRIYKWMIFHIGHLVYCRVTVDSLGCCLVLLRFLGMSTQNLTRSLEPGLDNRIVVGTWAMPGMRCRYVKNPFRDWWFLWFFSVSLVISPSKLSSRHIQITMTLSLSLSNFMIVYRFYVQNIIFHVSGTPVSFAPRIQSIHWAAGLQFK